MTIMRPLSAAPSNPSPTLIPEMILCDTEITDLCINAQLVTPFNPQLVNPASIDVTLGGLTSDKTYILWMGLAMQSLALMTEIVPFIK